jgi:hypothetical protein
MEELKKETTTTTTSTVKTTTTFDKLLHIIEFDKDIFKCAIDENYWM